MLNLDLSVNATFFQPPTVKLCLHFLAHLSAPQAFGGLKWIREASHPLRLFQAASFDKAFAV